MTRTPEPASPLPGEKLRIGISSCLLGDQVRFDGGHKRDAFIVDHLGPWVEFVPVCPEVAIGLGIPRQPIHLVNGENGIRVVGVRDPSLDVTEPLLDYGREMAGQLTDLCGYILKSRSPSCGMERVKVYGAGGGPGSKTGVGLYAKAFMEAHPTLPVEEEGRLGDPVLRENFIERIFTYARWQAMVRRGLSAAAIVDFHTRHKLCLLAHGEVAYRRMGRMVANAGKVPPRELADAYLRELMAVLTLRATRRRHANVLQHLAGYLKRALDSDDRTELGEVIDEYRLGRVPLIVPITLFRHHFRRHPDPYVEAQVYLHPHPPELMLRNLI